MPPAATLLKLGPLEPGQVPHQPPAWRRALLRPLFWWIFGSILIGGGMVVIILAQKPIEGSVIINLLGNLIWLSEIGRVILIIGVGCWTYSALLLPYRVHRNYHDSNHLPSSSLTVKNVIVVLLTPIIGFCAVFTTFVTLFGSQYVTVLPPSSPQGCQVIIATTFNHPGITEYAYLVRPNSIRVQPILGEGMTDRQEPMHNQIDPTHRWSLTWSTRDRGFLHPTGNISSSSAVRGIPLQCP